MTQTVAGSSASMSTLSFSHIPNHIDLTLDDEDSNDSYPHERYPKRARLDSSPIAKPGPSVPEGDLPSTSSTPTIRFSPHNQKSSTPVSHISFVESSSSQGPSPQYPPNYPPNQGPIKYSSSTYVPHYQQRPLPLQGLHTRKSFTTSFPSPHPPPNHHLGTPNHQVIDLTGSPSPPPMHQPPAPPLPSELPPKTPVCIGQLTVTALVLYPVPYLLPRDHIGEADWASVRLQYEHNPQKPGGSETIHIKTPQGKGIKGEVIQGEIFGVVEQKVATSLGPMLGKGLIRLDAKVRRGQPNVTPPFFSFITENSSILCSSRFFPYKCSSTLLKVIYRSSVIIFSNVDSSSTIPRYRMMTID